MKVRCIDIESTGIPSDEEAHAICEIGFVDIVDDVIGLPDGRLVNPGRPMPIPAMAVHHIRDVDVVGAIDPGRACMVLMDGQRDYFCAHNSDFDRKFFGGGETPWLDTYKTALRLWPEAPGHKLQELRYFLDIDNDPDFDRDLVSSPHRAPSDAYICAFILRKLFATGTKIEQMVKWSNGPALLYMCFMPKHRNKPWRQVAKDDPSYCRWILDKSDITDRDIRATVKYWLNQTA
jgi:exodeoxyribonuclease X